jgi:acyl-coenzyme A thioesterase PaaI-like protein
MNQMLAVTKVEAVEEIGPGIFEVRLLLEDASTARLRMNGPTLCSLADMASQYATP